MKQTLGDRSVYRKRPRSNSPNDTMRWRRQHISRGFILTLWFHLNKREFTNSEAYELYTYYRSKKSERALDRLYKAINEGLDRQIIDRLEREVNFGDAWSQMNVRNHLSALAYRAPVLLERIKPGVYRFEQSPLWYEYGIAERIPNPPESAGDGCLWFKCHNGDLLRIFPWHDEYIHFVEPQGWDV